MDPRFAAGLPFLVHQVIEFVAFRDSGNFSTLSQDFPGIFLGNCRKDPRNSHSLLEFSDAMKPFSCGFPQISGAAPRIALRIGFRMAQVERAIIPKVAPRMPWNAESCSESVLATLRAFWWFPGF